MDSKKYYERHLRWGYISNPYGRRLMDYLLARAETYPRCIDGTDVPPGRVFTSHAELCADIEIPEDEISHAINALNSRDLVRITSYSATTICLTIVLDPDEITTPPAVGTRFIASAQPAHPKTHSENTPAVGAQYIAPAQAAHPKTHSENTPAIGSQSLAPARPAPSKESNSNEVGAQYIAPAQSAHSKNPFRPNHPKCSLALAPPIQSHSKPRRGVLMFSPMWSAAEHGVLIEANRNEPRRGGIVLPSKTAPSPQPKHLKWSVALDRPTRRANRPRAHPPVRGAPS